MKTITAGTLVALVAICAAGYGYGADYTLQHDVTGDAGAVSSSALYTLMDTLGQPGPVNVSASTGGSTLEHGFWHAEPPAVSAVADAGDDFFGYESRPGTIPLPNYLCPLDGTRSTGVVTCLWEQIAGKTVTLRNPDTLTPDFDAPHWNGSVELTKTEARLRFRLTVNGGADTDECEVYIRIPGDANGDDVVNAFDVALFRQVPPHPDADCNGDGTVNMFDIAILRANSARRRTVP